MIRNGKDFFNRVINPSETMLSYVSAKGIYMDTDRCNALIKETAEVVERLDTELRESLKPEHRDINFGSPKQVCKWLYEDLGLEVPDIQGGQKNPVPVKRERSGAKKANFTEVALLSLAKEHRWLKPLVNLKKLSTRLSYLKKLPLHNWHDGRIRSQLSATTATWRLTSSSPNMQQLEEYIRYAFIAPNGKLLIVFDYSALEFVIMAHTIYALTGKRDLINDIEAGIDPHGAAAVRLGYVDCTPNEVKKLYKTIRDNIKTLVYGIPYGKTSFSLGVQLVDDDGFIVGQEEAERQLQAFIDAQPGLRETLELLVDKAKYFGYTTSLLGNRRYIENINSRNEYAFRKAANKARNKIQTDAAVIVTMAMLKTNAYRWHPDQRWYNKFLADRGCELVLQVHDELVFEVDEKYADEAAAEIKYQMENCLNGVVDFHAPLTVSGGPTDCWKGGH